MPGSPRWSPVAALGWGLAVALVATAPAAAQVVPGTGQRVWIDNLEDEEWTYHPYNPKSSQEQDEQVREPRGRSANGLWYEGRKRGHPDLVRRIDTPPGGIPGSAGALLMQTLYSGVPGRLSGQQMQDDLIMNTPAYRVGVEPSVVVRVFLPEWELWEPRSGASFGFRTDVTGRRTVNKPSSGLFSTTKRVEENERSWPGIFINFEKGRGAASDHAYIILRGAEHGDVRSRTITEPGWMTLGMSFTGDGRCHYYARMGVDDLRPEDRLGSYFPYNFKVEVLNGMFFDIFNLDNGQSWSTPWVVDDPAMYVGRHETATRPR